MLSCLSSFLNNIKQTNTNTSCFWHLSCPTSFDHVITWLKICAKSGSDYVDLVVLCIWGEGQHRIGVRLRIFPDGALWETISGSLTRGHWWRKWIGDRTIYSINFLHLKSWFHYENKDRKGMKFFSLGGLPVFGNPLL